MQDLYYNNMKFAWVPEDENFRDVSSNDRYTLKQLLAIFPALYPLPKSCIGQYITMETARKLFNGSFVWQDPEAGNNYEILDGCLISCEGLVQLRSMTSYQETHPY